MTTDAINTRNFSFYGNSSVPELMVVLLLLVLKKEKR